MIKYIKATHSLYSENKETLFHKSINVFIKEPIKGISLINVLNKVEEIIPKRLLTNIEVIYIGKFDFLEDKEVNAMYKDGAIYISNEQDDEQDMLDDFIHEISHAVEEKYNFEIYGDSVVEEEFLEKRKKLYSILKAYDFQPDVSLFLEPEYSELFDNFLYKKVGYSKLEQFSMNLFISPYSVTSLREYFATGFESYYLNNQKELKSLCTQLYNKIEEIALSEE